MYCKKCGESLSDAAEFCMKCGTKVDKVVVEKKETEKTDNKKNTNEGNLVTNNVENKSQTLSGLNQSEKPIPSKNFIEENPSVFHVENNINNQKKNLNNKKNNKKKINKKILMSCIIVGVILALGLIAWFVYDSEFTPKAKYNKGTQIYNELCAYTSSSSYSSDFVIDKECAEKIDKGVDLFKEAGDYEDAKLYHHVFRAASYI